MAAVRACSVNRKLSSRICDAPVTRASESGSANRIRSYLVSVVSRNARPSLTCRVTRGSWYGWSGFFSSPISMIRGSMSTASMCLAPLDNAIATSEPEPAPMISTLSSELLRRALVGEAVLRFLQQSLRGGSHDLVRDAVDRDVGQRDVGDDPVLGVDLVVRRPGDPGDERLDEQRGRPSPARRRRPGTAATCRSG